MQAFLDSYGYLALLVGTFLEGETIMVLGGFAAQRQYLDLPTVVMVGFLGSFVGDQLYFYIGRRWGPGLLARRPAWQDRAERAFGLLRRYDTLFILSFRFIYGVRSISSFVIGTAKVSPLRFFFLNMIAAFIWAVALGLMGYAFGAVVAEFLDEIAQYEKYVFGALVLVGIAFWLAHRLRRARARKRKERLPLV